MRAPSGGGWGPGGCARGRAAPRRGRGPEGGSGAIMGSWGKDPQISHEAPPAGRHCALPRRRRRCHARRPGAGRAAASRAHLHLGVRGSLERVYGVRGAPVGDARRNSGHQDHRSAAGGAQPGALLLASCFLRAPPLPLLQHWASRVNRLPPPRGMGWLGQRAHWSWQLPALRQVPTARYC